MKTCINCKWLSKKAYHEDEYECHRYPPTAVPPGPLQAKSDYAVFPRISSYWYCGEFTAKEKM